jgi:RimJ/RimL family protein N-acetyltransferase
VPETAFSIRQLRAGDWVAFRALRLKALETVPTAFGASQEEDAALSPEALRERLERAPSAVFGAFAGDSLIGMAGFHAQLGAKRRHRGLLWGVFVEEAYRGRGCARKLVERVIAHAGEHVVVLEAGVTAGNRNAAALYESLGFRIAGLIQKALRIDGAFHDEILLALDLEEPVSPSRG